MAETACDQCGVTFEAARSTRRYCCDACRQARHRGDKPKTWRPCEGLDCDGLIPPWMRTDARYCSPQCRDHDYYAYGGPPLPALVLADLGQVLAPRLPARPSASS